MELLYETLYSGNKYTGYTSIKKLCIYSLRYVFHIFSHINFLTISRGVVFVLHPCIVPRVGIPANWGLKETISGLFRGSLPGCGDPPV